MRAAGAEGRRALGAGPFVISDSPDNLAAALLHRGDLDGAERVVRESVELNRRLHGANSPRVALAEYNLACVLARRGKNGEAMGLLEAAVSHELVRDAALQMSSDSDLVGLRDEPRFKALIAEITKAE